MTNAELEEIAIRQAEFSDLVMKALRTLKQRLDRQEQITAALTVGLQQVAGENALELAEAKDAAAEASEIARLEDLLQKPSDEEGGGL